jgi:hypothetical protein
LCERFLFCELAAAPCDVTLRDPAKVLIADALSEYSEFHAPTIIGCVALACPKIALSHTA